MSSTHRAESIDSQTLWTEPGAWPTADGVWRIPLPLPNDGLRAVNVYAIKTASGLTLIDGGWAITTARTQLESALSTIGYEIGDITSFLVTHVHRDHYTQAVVLRRETGAHVSLGLGDKPSLDRLLTRPSPDCDRRLGLLHEAGASELAIAWTEQLASSPRDQTYWELPDRWLDGDQDIAVGTRNIQAIHTPGHTQGHFVYRDDAAGLLFAGDHVLPTITPSIGFETEPALQPLGDFMASLTKVRGLPDSVLLPAHGPVARSVHTRVDELLAHHEQRLRHCLECLSTGPLTSHAVARVLPWTGRERPFSSLDTANAVLATLETRAHLELLVAQGRAVGPRSDEGPREYSLPPDGPGISISTT